MTTATTSANVDAALRTQLDYYSGGSYDLAERFVTADYIDHEAPPGTPGRSKRRAALAARRVQRPLLRGQGRVRLWDRVAVEPLTERAH
jgi:hypothetical protein